MNRLSLILLGVLLAWPLFAATDLTKVSKEDLVQLLASGNSWQRRQAQRLLSEKLTDQDTVVVGKLAALAGPGASAMSPVPALATRMAALEVLHASGTLTEKMLDDSARDESVDMRVWAARFTGERGDAGKLALTRLEKLAAEAEPRVRAAVAAALRQFTSGSLTVDTPPRSGAAQADLLPHFKELLSRPSVAGDSYYPHIVWMAMEPRVAADPQPFLPLLGANDNSVSAYCLRRVMRRICDLADAAARTRQLNAALEFLGPLAPKTDLASAALDGLIDAFKSKGQPPTVKLEPILAKLAENPKLADKTRRLATLLGDTSASRSLIAKINDAKASLGERLKGITAARETKDDLARAELLKLFKGPFSPASEAEREKMAQSVYVEGLRALGTFGGDDIAYVITDAWKKFNLPTRRVAGDVLVTRSKWSRALLAAVDKKVVEPPDISATARRALARSEDATVRDHADRVLGHYRATGEDKLNLIAAKRAVVLAGEPDTKNGYEVAKRTCFVCHKLHGEGADVGPDLTGVGRSTLDALLHNVIDPNEVVGNGNEATEVELKDGSTVSGRIVEDSPTRLKLVAAGPVEHILARSDIAVGNGRPMIRTSQLSLMPEGLEVIPDKDFRDMIWFLLNPPGDNRPWTPALRKELFGDENAGAKKAALTQPPLDMESVSLWNPDWKVNCLPFEGAPAKLTELHGRKNVLMTHPASRDQAGSLERTLDVPREGAKLHFKVAAHDQGDWEMRVVVNDQLFMKQIIKNTGQRWKTFDLSLNRWVGQRVKLRLENAANDWSFEFGYWSDIEIKTADLTDRTP